MTEAARDRYSARKEKPRVTSETINDQVRTFLAGGGSIDKQPIRVNGIPKPICKYRECGASLKHIQVRMGDKRADYCDAKCHRAEKKERDWDAVRRKKASTPKTEERTGE